MAQPGSPQATRYFILLHVLQVDFMQGGQQTLRLTTLLIDQGIPNHDFLLYRGSTVLQLSCPYPDFGAPQFPTPMRDSWCATLIRKKCKEGYRAPWLSKECIFFREGSGKSIAIGISLPWYAQDSRGDADSKFPFLSLFPEQKQTFDKFRIVNVSFTISIRNSHLKISKL